VLCCLDSGVNLTAEAGEILQAAPTRALHRELCVAISESCPRSLSSCDARSSYSVTPCRLRVPSRWSHAAEFMRKNRRRLRRSSLSRVEEHARNQRTHPTTRGDADRGYREWRAEVYIGWRPNALTSRHSARARDHCEFVSNSTARHNNTRSAHTSSHRISVRGAYTHDVVPDARARDRCRTRCGGVTSRSAHSCRSLSCRWSVALASSDRSLPPLHRWAGV
jgi:hypothetical protein